MDHKVKANEYVQVYQWKNGEILLMQIPDRADASEHYRVIGNVLNSQKGHYVVRPVLKKEQRHCRAFLRGRMTLAGRARISFLEDV